jgi:hypothetical protein
MEDIKKASQALAANYAIFARYNDRVATALLSKLGRFSPGETVSHLEEIKRLKAEAELFRAAAKELVSSK